jgi:hypothetical protein
MTASASQTELTANPAFSASRPELGSVIGGVRLTLRLEGLAALAAALAFYGHNGFSWSAFALLFLAPDLSMLAYLAGPRVGAWGYNLAHTDALAIALTLAGFFTGLPLAAAGGLIWIAHIGFDRALGYGLKYPTAFRDTHLGRLGWHRARTLV